MSGGVTEEGQQAFKAIFINGHPNGSLMVRMGRTEERLDTVESTVAEIKKGIDELPKKLAVYLTILTLIIGLLTVIAPALQKSLGLAQVPHTSISLNADNSPAFTAARR